MARKEKKEKKGNYPDCFDTQGRQKEKLRNGSLKIYISEERRGGEGGKRGGRKKKKRKAQGTEGAEYLNQWT